MQTGFLFFYFPFPLRSLYPLCMNRSRPPHPQPKPVLSLLSQEPGHREEPPQQRLSPQRRSAPLTDAPMERDRVAFVMTKVSAAPQRSRFSLCPATLFLSVIPRLSSGHWDFLSACPGPAGSPSAAGLSPHDAPEAVTSGISNICLHKMLESFQTEHVSTQPCGQCQL